MNATAAITALSTEPLMRDYPRAIERLVMTTSPRALAAEASKLNGRLASDYDETAPVVEVAERKAAMAALSALVREIVAAEEVAA